MMTLIAVLYHAGCIDGFTAAWAVHKHKHRPDKGTAVELIPVTHGQPPPNVERFSEIYVVDIAYPYPELEAVAESGRNVTLLDHHQTALDWYRPHFPGVEDEGLLMAGVITNGGTFQILLDMNRSGAGITWEYLSDEPMPDLVRYVQDRDLWTNELPNTRAVSVYLRTLEPTVELWDQLAGQAIGMIAQAGQGACKQLDAIIRAGVDQSFMCRIGDREFPITNVPWLAGSETAEALCNHWDTGMAGYFYQTADGGWKYGFRARDENTRVDKFAEAFGGGGHKSASGAYSEQMLHVIVPNRTPPGQPMTSSAH